MTHKVELWMDSSYPVYGVRECRGEGSPYAVDISDDLWNRYIAAEVAYEAVQEELAKVYARKPA